MALTRQDVEEMRTLASRISHGSVTREDWSNLAALTLMAQGDETIAAISAQGLDHFIAVASPVFEGHAFQYDDFQRIYTRICRAARYAAARTTVH
jgi:hypothetical protein